MPHYHHCEVCKIPVANCSDDSCKADESHPNAGHIDANDTQTGKHYCSLHHPDPKHHVEPVAPPPRYAVLVKDQK